jgi:adenylylsulfate kinase-like enzyme
MHKINKKKGILFWITGLSGAGKTTIGNKIKKDISRKYGPTLMISGDNIRRIFNLKGYEYKERLLILEKYTKFAKYITDQKLNIIFAVVGMADAPRKWNRKNIDNYMEIYIKCNIRKIMNLDKKKIYHNKKSGKIIGIDIKPEFPKKPDITIINSFNETGDKIAKKLLKKINNLIKIKT